VNIDPTQSLEDAVAEYAAAHPKDQKWCNFFWGSHGCSLNESDHRVHVCGWGDPDGPCTEYDEDRPAEARIRQWYDGRWHEWQAYPDGWRQKW